MAGFSSEITDRLSATGVVAVLMIDDVDAAVPLAQALCDGGVDAMELTLRTPVAFAALREIRRHVPQMLAGIGTILTPAQIREAVAAGAAFGVSPGTNPVVVQTAHDHGLPFAPGIATPTDIEIAVSLGCRVLKFFPAEPSGGLSYLRSIAAPFLHLGVQFLPLGGVNSQNMVDYLADPTVLAVGGSWLAPRELIQSKNWDGLRARAAEASEIIRGMVDHGK